MRQNDNLPTRHAGQNNLSTYRGGSRQPDFLQSPWQMMRSMQEELDRVFGGFMSGWPGFPSPGDQQWSPSMDISQTDNEWRVEADLPGVNEEDIHVSVNNGYLTLKAEMRQGEPSDDTGNERRYHQRERRYGYFERVLPLPAEVDEEKISCDFKNGVLSLHLPRSQKAVAQARKIPIGRGSAETHQTAGTSDALSQSAQGNANGAAPNEKPSEAITGGQKKA